MNNELWLNYSEQVALNLASNKVPYTTNTIESLEATWHKIQTSVISAALQHIPNKKFTVRNFQHIFSAKASKLHCNLKRLGNIIRQVKASIRNHSPIPTIHNLEINQINSNHQLNIPFVPQQSHLLTEWLTAAKTEWKTLYHARNIENTKNIREQINNNIDKRCSKLQHNPTSMINSILNRHQDPVKFDNIKDQNNVITDIPSIKQHIQQHFDNWTAPRNTQPQLFDSLWQSEYLPKPNVDPLWYQSALADFSTTEIINTLSQLPNNKACGPSGVSYEMLKHAGPLFTEAITALLNRCLSSGQIPNQWKE